MYSAIPPWEEVMLSGATNSVVKLHVVACFIKILIILIDQVKGSADRKSVV